MSWTCDCGCTVDEGRAVCTYCGTAKGEKSPQSASGATRTQDSSAAKLQFVVIGLCLGVLLGFLVRPSIPLVGQLPFGVVITRGAGLKGVDQLLRPYAEQSFNYVLVGAILGGLIGYFAHRHRTSIAASVATFVQEQKATTEGSPSPQTLEYFLI